MRLISTLVVLVNLTACASYWDRNDPCQVRAELNRPEGYQRPNYCGASPAAQVVVRNNRGFNNGQVVNYMEYRRY